MPVFQAGRNGREGQWREEKGGVNIIYGKFIS